MPAAVLSQLWVEGGRQNVALLQSHYHLPRSPLPARPRQLERACVFRFHRLLLLLRPVANDAVVVGLVRKKEIEIEIECCGEELVKICGEGCA